MTQDSFDFLMGFTLGGLGLTATIVGLQIFGYLFTGEWYPVSAIAALSIFDVSWAINPRVWIGVHQILSATPLSLAILIITVLPLWTYLDRDEKKRGLRMVGRSIRN